MGTTLSPKDQEELARLLRHVAEQDARFIPDKAYRPFHRLVPWPAVEVLIHDAEGQFLLSYRDDQDLRGWHIPGGYMKPNETIDAACNRIVRKEGVVATGVDNLRLIAAHPWTQGEHPYGYPLSLIIACRAIGEVQARSDLQWFSEIPPTIIPVHRPFLDFFLEWERQGRPWSAEIL